MNIPKADLAFVGWMARAIREGVVSDLLAGNDAQCFTTNQYAEAYRKGSFASDLIPLTTELAEIHLRSLPDLVREVRPGIWAPVEEPAS